MNPYAPVTPPNADVNPGDVPQLEPPQSVRYHYSAELLQAFWAHRTLTCQGDVRARRIASAQYLVHASGIVTGALLLLIPEGPESFLQWCGALLLGLFALKLLVVAIRSRSSTAIRGVLGEMAHRYLSESANQNLLAERTVTVGREGVRETQPAAQCFTQWRAYERIEHDGDYLFMYDSAMSAVIVPRSAFATRAQFLGFANLCERLWQESSHAEGAPPLVSPREGPAD